MSSCAWPYLIAPAFWCATFHCAQLGQRLDRRRCAERREPRVEVALHAVLEDDRAVGVPALRVVEAAADAPEQQVRRRVRRDDARDVGRIDDRRRPAAAGPRSPRPSPRAARRSGRRAAPSLPAASIGVVVERARDADARALQRRRACRNARVVAARRRRARASSPDRSGSGAAPSSAPSRIAASVTARAIGPGVSWSAVIGMTP